MKKLLALLLCVVMLVGVMSTAAYAEEDPLAAARDLLLTEQETAIAKAFQELVTGYANLTYEAFGPFYAGEIYVTSGAQLAEILFAAFQAAVEEQLDGVESPDLIDFASACVTAYQAFGAYLVTNTYSLYVQSTAAAIVEAMIASYPEGYDYHNDPTFQWVAALS